MEQAVPVGLSAGGELAITYRDFGNLLFYG